MDYIYSQVKKKLWWSNIWSAGHFTSTVGENGDENQIKNYMRNQEKKYTKYIEIIEVLWLGHTKISHVLTLRQSIL